MGERIVWLRTEAEFLDKSGPAIALSQLWLPALSRVLQSHSRRYAPASAPVGTVPPYYRAWLHHQLLQCDIQYLPRHWRLSAIIVGTFCLYRTLPSSWSPA